MENSSHFLRLPAEIRLEIYRYLLLPPPSAPSTSKTSTFAACTSYYDYEATLKPKSSKATTKQRTLHFRILDPQKSFVWTKDVLPTLKRSKCLVRTDRFRGRTMETTYGATNSAGIQASVLGTCRLVHAEAAEVLYGSYTFDFDTHVEVIGAFLRDLTPLSRSFVKSASLIKRAMPYDREFDVADWEAATDSLSQLPALRTLHLGVVAGKPGPAGWENVPEWSKEDFRAMARWRNWEGFEWVRELRRVKLVEGGRVEVRAIVEHCPPPESESMKFWVGVSRNVEGGFGEWVRELVLGA